MPARRFESITEVAEFVDQHPNRSVILLFCGIYYAEDQKTADSLKVEQPGYYLYRKDFSKFLPQHMCVVRDMEGFHCNEPMETEYLMCTIGPNKDGVA